MSFVLSRSVLMLLGGAAIAVVIFVQYQMIRNLREQVTALNLQTSALEHANTTMRNDIIAIQKLQQQANQTLTGIRLGAAKSAQDVQARRFTGSHQHIQQQVNQETAALFGRLQDISRAP